MKRETGWFASFQVSFEAGPYGVSPDNDAAKQRNGTGGVHFLDVSGTEKKRVGLRGTQGYGCYSVVPCFPQQ